MDSIPGELDLFVLEHDIFSRYLIELYELYLSWNRASGTIHNLAQITPAPNVTTSTGNGTGVLVTQFSGFQELNGSLTFEPVVWYGSDPNLPRAQSCWSAITSQQLQASSFYDASVANRTWPVTESSTVFNGTYTTTTAIYPTDVSTYKLCDGSPRVDRKPITQTITAVSSGYPSTEIFNVTATPTLSLSPPCGNPNNGELCYDWYRFSNLTDDYESNGSNDVRLLEHECGNPAHYDPNTFNASSWPCLIGGGPVQLYYFPVDTGNQSLCSNRTAISSGSPTTPPPTVVTDGITMTSGSVYVSFSTLFAYYDGFGYGPGTNYKDLIITLASSQVSTNCGNDNGIGTQINYADFNYPIAASAYSCAHPCAAPCVDATCTPQACSTIWDDFNPVMAIPTPVLDLQAAWKTCSFADENGPQWLFDPPQALTQAAREAQPTVPGGGDAPSSPTPAPAQSQPPDNQPSEGGVTVPSPKPTPQSPAAQQTNPPAAQSDNLPSNGNQQPSPSNNNNNPPQSNGASPPAPSPSNGGNGQSPQNSPTSPNSPGSQNNPGAQNSPAPQNSPGNQNSPAPANSQGAQSPPAAQNSPGPQNSPSNQNSPQNTPSTNNQGSPSNQQNNPNSQNNPNNQQNNPNGQNNPSNQQNNPGGSDQQNSPAGSNNNNQPAPVAQVTAGSNTIQANQLPGNSIAVGGTTLAPGEAATISGVAVSADPSGNNIIVGSQTAGFAPAPANNDNNAVFAAGDATITAAAAPGASNAVVVGGNTLSQGGSVAVVNGQTISQGQNGPVVINGGNTQALNRVGGSSSVFAAGSVSITASPAAGTNGAMVVDGTTLSAGGSAAVVNGQTISQGSSGLMAVNGDNTQTLNPVAAPSVFTAGSLTITASPAAGTNGAMVIDGTTLSLGGSAAVINGQTISDASGGLVAVGPSGTSTLSPAASGGDAQTLAFGSLTITASAVPGSSGMYVVDGTTVSPSGSVVVDGTTVSDRSGTLMEVDSRTTAVFSTVGGSASRTTGSSSRGSASGAASPAASSTSRSGAGTVSLSLSLGAVVFSGICMIMI
ncbi:hypothetical protein PRZ48_008061 [Zasmidium cellare]|uniref:Uncharacterized protein n=1 Tax=Zasmidium cellare TaxID=395010 RepID=A0ABR0EFH1_ZASCE|nr:hypothetical protein PRZ48_008061 [Zasmidium cellare]